MRPAALALALPLLLSCSSKKEAPAPEEGTPAPRADATPPSPEAACAAGDAAACRRAGRLDAACLHGDAAACALHGETVPSEKAKWVERGCRRGATEGCGERAALRITLEEPVPGALAERIDKIYRHAVGDCFIDLDASGEVVVSISASERSAASENDALATCVEASVAGWSLAGIEIPETQRFVLRGVAPPKPVAERAVVKAGEGAVLMMLVGGDDGDSAGDLASAVDPGADLDKAIADIKKQPGSGSLKGSLGSADTPRSRVKLGKTAPRSDELAPGPVARKIRSRYLAGIKRCHHQRLKTDREAGGRVKLRFTVGTTGRVVNASAKGFDDDVDKCIVAQMKRWRFGTPKTDVGEPTTAEFALPIVLEKVTP